MSNESKFKRKNPNFQHVNFGNTTGTTEAQARQAFKSITSDMVADVYLPYFAKVKPFSTHPRYIVPTLNPEDVYYGDQMQGDVLFLTETFDDLDVKKLIYTYSDIFSNLLKPQQRLKTILGNGIELAKGTQSILAPVTRIAFMRDRQGYFFGPQTKEAFKSVPSRSLPFGASLRSPFIMRTPDLSHLETAEDRLDGLIRMLSLTHEQVLAEVCEREVVSIDELAQLRQNDPQRLSSIYRQSGIILATETLYGVLNDSINGGKDSLFRYSKFTSRSPLTALHQCPAKPFVGSFLEGIGMALRENRAHLLEAMRS